MPAVHHGAVRVGATVVARDKHGHWYGARVIGKRSRGQRVEYLVRQITLQYRVSSGNATDRWETPPLRRNGVCRVPGWRRLRPGATLRRRL